MNSITILIAVIVPIIFACLITMENFTYGASMLMHNHVSLNVTIGGRPIGVPASIGITQKGLFADPMLFADHTLDKYGMEGMSPLHTHDYSGLIHVESNTVRSYTLGEFLDIWKGLNTDGKHVMALVDGKAVPDFRNIPLNDKTKIVLNIS